MAKLPLNSPYAAALRARALHAEAEARECRLLAVKMPKVRRHYIALAKVWLRNMRALNADAFSLPGSQS